MAADGLSSTARALSLLLAGRAWPTMLMLLLWQSRSVLDWSTGPCQMCVRWQVQKGRKQNLRMRTTGLPARC